jgi:hypothetical protein
MTLINIKPVAVGLNQTANAISIQVLTLDLTPEKFNLNARFFSIDSKNIQTELLNIPFELPIEDYSNWISDTYLENKSLEALNLERA